MTLALTFLPLIFFSASVSAATVISSFGVSATVQASCLASASPLSVGAYRGMTARAASAVSVDCTNSTLYNVAIGAAPATGVNATTRKMISSGSVLLSYLLTADAAAIVGRAQTVDTGRVTGDGNDYTRALNVQSGIPAELQRDASAYAGALTITITY